VTAPYAGFPLSLRGHEGTAGTFLFPFCRCLLKDKESTGLRKQPGQLPFISFIITLIG